MRTLGLEAGERELEVSHGPEVPMDLEEGLSGRSGSLRHLWEALGFRSSLDGLQRLLRSLRMG